MNVCACVVGAVYDEYEAYMCACMYVFGVVCGDLVCECSIGCSCMVRTVCVCLRVGPHVCLMYVGLQVCCVCVWCCMLPVQVVIACVCVAYVCVVYGVYGVFVLMCSCDVYVIYMV